MKYLKLTTTEKLPLVKDATQGKSHITIVYFGKVEVNSDYVKAIFMQLKPFTLKKVKADMFGKNKDIPVVVYEVVDALVKDMIHDVRLDVLNKCNVLHDNFVNWNPHVSNVDFDECPDILYVTGIESNNDELKISFNSP